MLLSRVRSSEFWVLTIIVLVNMLLRIPAVLQDLPPFNFCDESLVVGPGYGLAEPGSWIQRDYLYGGTSYYLPALIAKFFNIFGIDFRSSIVTFTLFERFLFCVFLSSFAVLFIYSATKSFFKNNNLAYLSMAIFTLSPMALGLSQIAYPDHYVVFFSAGFIYFCSCIMESAEVSIDFEDKEKRINKASRWAGLFIGFALGVKYYCVILFFPLVLAHLSLFRWDKPLSISALWRSSLRLRTSLWFSLWGFLICCPTLLIYFAHFLSDMSNNLAHYKGGHTGLESDHGFSFYSKVVFLTSFGVLGAVLFALGIYRNLKTNFVQALFLALPPLILILMLGQYRVVIVRNMAPLMPFVFILQAYGLWSLLQWRPIKNSKLLQIFILLLFFAEPTYKSLYSYVHDFFPDARKTAFNWTSENIPKTSPIGAAYACWGLAVGGGDLRLQTIPTELAPGECIDYYVMDEWFYEIRSAGHEMLTVPIYNNLMFFNPSRMDYSMERKLQDRFLENFELIKEFKNGYHGPAVWIYKAKKQCAANHIQPPKRAFGWFGESYIK